MKYSECNSCVEKNCGDCLICRIHGVSEEDIAQVERLYGSEEDFSTALISR